MHTLHCRLGELLKARGTNAHALHRRTGVTYAQILRLARNELTQMGFHNLAAICVDLNITMEDLFNVVDASNTEAGVTFSEYGIPSES